MAPIALIVGGLFIGLGLVGYFDAGLLGEFDQRSKTALIPAWIGGVLVICGVVALLKTSTRKHMMHLAVLAGLVGLIGGFMPLFRSEFNFKKASAVSGALMIALSAVFVALCVKSFIDARKARQAAT
jgi:uncharacterized membrane protein